MDIDTLRTFLAVTEHRSFSTAAKALFITQPAVSKRIASLETRLGQTLFHRLGKDVTLTESGKLLLSEARTIVHAIDDVERRIREHSGTVAGTLNVATSHHIGLHHLPPLLRCFASRYPQANLQFEFVDSEDAFDKVMKGRCELGIVTLAPQITPPLTSCTLWHDKLHFVVGQHHPLANTPTLTLSQLSEYCAILPDAKTFTGRLIKACFDQAGLSLTVNMATNYLETIKMMVSVGLGWSALPTTLIDKHMVCLNVLHVSLVRKLGVILHQQRPLSNVAKAFYQLLVDAEVDQFDAKI